MRLTQWTHVLKYTLTGSQARELAPVVLLIRRIERIFPPQSNPAVVKRFSDTLAQLNSLYCMPHVPECVQPPEGEEGQVRSSKDSTLVKQLFFFCRNIGQVTPKIGYFRYLWKYFLDQSIQKMFYLYLQTEVLLFTDLWSVITVGPLRMFLTEWCSSWSSSLIGGLKCPDR